MKNIPYDKIDEEMVELIRVLNDVCKIPTRNCCSGHKKRGFYIQFDEDVKDRQMYELANILFENIENKDDNRLRFSIQKWGRKLDKTFQYHWSLKSEISVCPYEVFGLINEITVLLKNTYKNNNKFINWLNDHSKKVFSEDEYLFPNRMFPDELDIILFQIPDIKIINEYYEKNIKLIEFEYKGIRFLLCIDLNTGVVNAIR